ncbi:hypothetical protein K8I85_16350 [bacterium]|nr:hypothetical protein [bacterium]
MTTDVQPKLRPVLLRRAAMASACVGLLSASVASAQFESGRHYLSLGSMGPEGSLVFTGDSVVDQVVQETFVLAGGAYILESTSIISIRTDADLGYRSRRFENILRAQFSEPVELYSGHVYGVSSAEVRDPTQFFEYDELVLLVDPLLPPPPPALQWSNTEWIQRLAREAFGSVVVDMGQTPTELTTHFVGSARAADPNSTASEFAKGYSRGLVNWLFVAPPGTVLTLNWTATYDVLGSAGGPGSSADNPILPQCTLPPFCFGAVCDGCWIDPPATYGYRYDVSDRLVTGVSGWSPHLDGPVRVSVEGIDLGLFDPMGNLSFANYPQQLGSLLVGGVGVESFSVTEISPATFASDPLAFPIRIDLDGPETTTMVMTPLSEPPTGVAGPLAGDWLRMEMAASPNPFNPSVRVSFGLPGPASVDASVYSVAGRRVRSLATHVQLGAGEHHLVWRGDDDSGRRLASGVYFIAVEAAGRVGTIKVTLTK